MLFTAQASATDLILEPYMGYQLGKYSIGEGDSQDVSGLGIGARFVYFAQGIYGGFDIHHSTLNVSNGGDDNLKQNQIGLTAGFSFAVVPIRAWMTYVPSDSLKSDSGASYSGNGVKMAVGFDPIPLISFNVEFKTSTYDEQDDIPLNEKHKVSSIFFNIGLLFGTNL